MLPDTFIKAEDLSRFYERGPQIIKAVDNITLSIQLGAFLSVVGASGSGKSTLLNLLAGLDTPTSGKINIGGQVLGELSRRDLSRYRADKVGIIFQSFNLIGHYTALENVATALLFKEITKKERLYRAAEALEVLGLVDRKDHRPSDLSGGEQQRVAVARALVKEPEILFADEPTGNLDHDNSSQIANLLKELNKNGLTVIMVTHDLSLAKQCSERIIRMNYGRVDSGISDGGDK